MISMNRESAHPGTQRVLQEVHRTGLPPTPMRGIAIVRGYFLASNLRVHFGWPPFRGVKAVERDRSQAHAGTGDDARHH
jgi:hypothetical protein